MITFRITTIIAGGLGSTCPPAIVPALFHDFNGWPVTLTESECIVTAPEGTVPADLGPLVKVEVVAQG